ncbi:MAG: aldo/keto reductase [Acidimicrobiia bacterium]
MELRPLGASGLEVSALCLGSWLTFEVMDRDEGLAVMRAALDTGITFFDDACYDDHTGQAPMRTGWSEVLFGELFRKTGHPRDEIVMANKLWFEFLPDESVEAELNGSLERLGTDWIDVVYCAAPPEELPVPELVAALDSLVAKGKLRAWGGLNWSPELLVEAHRFATAEGLTPPTAVQLPHNVIDRGYVEGPSARKAFKKTGVAVVASHCLAGGLLTGKYNHPGATGRHGPQRIEKLRERGVLDRIDRWAALAGEHGASVAQLCLAFSLSRPAVASVCFGAKSTAQLAEDLGTLSVAGGLRQALVRLDDDTGPPTDPDRGSPP